MDRESIHRLLGFSFYVGLIFVLTGLSPLTGLTDSLNTEVMLLFFLPLLSVNLFSKTKGYLFRREKFIQVATMMVDHHPLSKTIRVRHEQKF